MTSYWSTKYIGRLAALCSIYLLVVFQLSFLSHFFPVSAVNLPWVLVFALLGVLGVRSSLYLSFSLGLIYDVLTLGLVGQTSLILLLAVLFYQLLRQYFSAVRLTFFAYFFLIDLLDRWFVWPKSMAPMIGFGLLDLLLLFLLMGFLRYLLSIFNPPGFLQLRFRQLS